MRIPLHMLVDRVAFVDPAAGKRGAAQVKKTRARAAIVVVGQDVLTRNFVLHAWADRCSTDALIDKMLEVNKVYRPRVFGGEASGLQSIFQDSIIREARYKNLRLPLVKVFQPTNQDKDFRIRAALQQIVRQGRLFLQAHQVELASEIRAFPRGKLKDMIDALASAVMLLPQRPAAKQQDDSIQALASYLRETGADPAYIVRRIQQVQRMIALHELEQAQQAPDGAPFGTGAA